MALPIVQSHSELAIMFNQANSRQTRNPIAPKQEPQTDTSVVRALASGLNDVERRTWWRLLDGWSITAIAEVDRVARAAIYSRICGSAGQSGMVHKNRWVALWWAARTGGRLRKAVQPTAAGLLQLTLNARRPHPHV